MSVYRPIRRRVVNQLLGDNEVIKERASPAEYYVKFGGEVEKRECPECGKTVKVLEETPSVWCPCEDRGVPLFPTND